MRTRLPIKPLSPLRRPSFAGRSLAERLRSTTFALFGLAAAAGLALVALFAQPGGPLLSPAPLPGESRTGSVAEAEAVEPSHAPRLVAGGEGRSSSLSPHSLAPVSAGGGTGAAGGPSQQSRGSGAVSSPSQPVLSPPQPEGEGGEQEGGGPEATPAPAPAPAPAPPSAPETVPVDSSAPEKAPVVHVSPPGHSAAGHSAADKVEAAVHSVLPPAPAAPPPVAVPPVVPGPPPHADNGHGHAYGHDR